jgi:hypothetical protein
MDSINNLRLIINDGLNNLYTNLNPVDFDLLNKYTTKLLEIILYQYNLSIDDLTSLIAVIIGVRSIPGWIFVDVILGDDVFVLALVVLDGVDIGVVDIFGGAAGEGVRVAQDLRAGSVLLGPSDTQP